MVAQTETRAAEDVALENRKPPPRNTGGEDGVAFVFGLLGGLLWAVANVAGCMMMAQNAFAAWTVLATAWVVYFTGLGALLWIGAAKRQQV